MSQDAALQKREIITSNSAMVGIKAGVLATIGAGVAVYAANQNSPWFRTRLGVSGKTGLMAMAGLAAFTIAAEQDLLEGSRNPDAYIANINHKEVEVKKAHTALPLHQRAANYIYDYPFRTLTCAAAPLVGAIFWDQNRNKSIQMSQKIMHTRIYGQGSVVLLLLSSMAFHDWMDKRGKFE